MDTAAAPLHFASVTNLSCQGCHEPAADVDAEGRIYVVASGLEGIGVSEDDGATWSLKPLPPISSPSPFFGMMGDQLVQIAPWGTLYYTRLASDSGGLLGMGIHFAASDDGGDTWHINRYMHVREDPTTFGVNSDRQWLAFEGNETVHLVFNCAASALICNMRSDDRGATFGVPSIVMTPLTHTYPSPAGFPTIGPDGTLIVPYFADPRADTSAGARSVMVAASRDGGQTFQHHTAYTHEPDFGAGSGGWPEATILADGTWVAGWSTSDDSLWFVFSEDAGASWGEPVVLSAEENGDVTGHHPWLLPRADGGLDAIWFTAGPGVRLGRLDTNGTWQMAQSPVEGGGMSDYPYFAHTPDDRVVTPFLTPEALHVAISDR